ncbi:MAG: IclR family transcriptional regulator [Verrucomicrobiota bacterium]
MPPKTEKKYSAPALEKGLDILEFLAGQPNPCSKAEIADALERTPSEIYRMLSVLEQRGYVTKQSGTVSYGLSLKLFELGHLQNGMTSLRKAVRQPMEQLADEIGQACHFSVQNGADLLIIIERMPARRVCLAVGEGTLLPITQTASGAVLLSQLDEDEAMAFLTEDTHYQQLSQAKKNAYQKRQHKIREQQFETAQSQFSPGVIDIALPIGIAGTDLSGALAVSLLGGDINAPIIQKYIRAMQHCANQINQNLGI